MHFWRYVLVEVRVVIVAISFIFLLNLFSSVSATKVGKSETQRHVHTVLRGEVYRGKSPQSLSLVHLSNRSITCNDGSPAGYYIRKSLNGEVEASRTWIIFLEGGWFCFDERSCGERWMRMRDFMTSDTWTKHKEVHGVLSSDPTENPYWWNANHVYVPYCSSDMWSGTSGGDGEGLKFMGALILEEIIYSLIRQEGLDRNSDTILAGSSAGGTGVMLNLDRVDSILRKEFDPQDLTFTKPTRVRGISDSGWFIDSNPFEGAGGGRDGDGADCTHEACSPKTSLKMGMKLWGSRLPENCLYSTPADKTWTCFFGFKIYPTLRAPLFIFQWQFDEAQMLLSNLPNPALLPTTSRAAGVGKEAWDFVYRLGDKIKKSLNNVTSVMMPSCISHTVLTRRDWWKVEVNSVFLPRALKCWQSGGIIQDPPTFNEGGHWSRNNPRELLSNTTSKHPLPRGDDMEGELNDSRRRTRHRHHHLRQEKHRQHSRTRSWQRRNNGDPIESLLLDQEERTEGAIIPGQKQGHEIDPTSSPKPNDKKKKRKKNKDKNYPNHRRHLINRRKNRKKLSGSGGGGKLLSLCGESYDEGNFVEKCSWPQCNKSCPKLFNPETGEEVDLKDLLNSFGLDLHTIAKALGIDESTLNRMEQPALLQILTQHS